MKNRKDLRKFATVFNNKSATQDVIAGVGEKLLLGLYGATKEEQSLNSF